MGSLNLTQPYRKLVAIRSPHNLGMLEKCLAETDPETTDVVVMTASVVPKGSADFQPTITDYDRQLLTAVVNLAEHAGKPVKPLIVPTNEPFYRPGPDRQDDRRPGADHGPVEQVPARGPARRRGALLVQRLRGQARAACRSACSARIATFGWISPEAARSPSPAWPRPRSPGSSPSFARAGMASRSC